ncbi:MAG: cysteinyl-tRNA synthetase [Actinomycetota bacterium]|nr:cysteinyl-tRNA synthetase [Actinomycetota bacterium]
MLRIFDTAARAKVEFVPRRAGHVAIYVCGPTVYDAPHVGHGRTAIAFDVIRRYFQWRGDTVTYVSNITDIEDKIIRRAHERGTTEGELAREYESAYWAQLDRVGVQRPDDMPHATQFVAQMQRLIAELILAGRAYVIEGQGVYFEVATLPDYGALSHRRTEDLLEGAGARVEVDDEKRSPLDFALWKAAKPGEPEWPSPWGPGRPGWHIECSAMSLEILGEGFDIHGGGDDLVFPHHENERAQAEGAGHVFARHWIHSGMVMVGKEKMSKSLGNFTNLSDALDRHGPRAFRLLALQTHYRKQLEMGDKELSDAGKAVDRLDALFRRARVAGVAEGNLGDIDGFRAAMDDDFDTPAALAFVFDLVRRANTALDAGDTPAVASLLATVRELAGSFGLEIDDGDRAVTSGTASAADAEIDALVVARDEARARRDFAEADRVRDELKTRGITLEDGPGGTTWHR